MDEPPDTGLDPQLAAYLLDGPGSDLDPWHTMGVDAARRVEDELFSPTDRSPAAAVSERTIDGPDCDLSVRVYRPSGSDQSQLPTVVFYHGGGWVLGTLDSADDICRAFATRIGAVVVSVDYRLAPEHPFPAAVEDAWAALSWVRSNAEAVGGDPDCVAVAGTSAGGGLAAAVALKARAEDVPLSAQLLCYPMLDRDFTRPSYREHADAPLLTRADVEWFWEQYLEDPVDAEDPLATPLGADSLAGVAPAVVTTAGHDVLRSEGAAYAERLAVAGVETTHCHYPSLAHGYLSLTDEVDRAETAMDEVTTAVADLLG